MVTPTGATPSHTFAHKTQNLSGTWTNFSKRHYANLPAMAEDEIVTGLPWSKGLTTHAHTLSEIRKLLEGTKWADSLSAKEVETLARYLHVCAAEAGSVIVKEGRREAYLCLIIEGHVSIVKEGAGHEAKQIGSAGVGRIIGEISLIDGEARSASGVAETPA